MWTRAHATCCRPRVLRRALWGGGCLTWKALREAGRSGREARVDTCVELTSACTSTLLTQMAPTAVLEENALAAAPVLLAPDPARSPPAAHNRRRHLGWRALQPSVATGLSPPRAVEQSHCAATAFAVVTFGCCCCCCFAAFFAVVVAAAYFHRSTGGSAEMQE